jgi:predicted nucleotidyltransferase
MFYFCLQEILLMVKVDALILELAQEFLARIRDQGIKIESAYLFGSYAKGTEHEWSDIDIAIISSDFIDNRFDERVHLMKLSCDIDTRIEPVPFRPERFTDNDPLASEIKKTGYLIA